MLQTRTGAEVRRFKVSVPDISNAVFAQSGRLLLLSSDKGAAYLWDIDADKEVRSFPSLGSAQAIAFSPDCHYIAVGGTGGMAHLWDIATGREVRIFKASARPLTIIKYAPDGQTLLASSKTGQVSLFDVTTGQLLRQIEAGGEITAIEFAPNGQTFATAGVDGAHLWESATGKDVRRFANAANAITSLSLTPDGRLLLTSGHDKAARLWEVATGKEIGELFSFTRAAGSAPDSNEWLITTPDGLFDGSEGGWEQTIWRTANDSFHFVPSVSFFGDFYYPNLLNELLGGKRPQAVQSIRNIDRRQPKVKLSIATRTGEDAANITTRNVRVKIYVEEAPAEPQLGFTTGSGAGDVRLLRNGLLVKAWRGDVLQGKSYATLEADIPIIAGENRLTAYAFNHDNIKSLDARLIITGAPSLKRAGTAYILTIGINQYDNPQFNLRFSVADAKAFGEELKHQQEKLGTFGRVELISLTDQQATKANILEAFNRLAGTAVNTLPTDAPATLEKIRRAEPEDVVFIYFAVHGTAQKNHYYLIPHDMGFTGGRTELKGEDLQQILNHSISDLELGSIFTSVDAGRFLLVLDTANSGQVLEADEKRLGPLNSTGFGQLAYEKGMFIMTAAQSPQTAVTSARVGLGLLTYALVEEGLKQMLADTAPKDGKVSMLEWMEYATARVPMLSELEQQKNLKNLRHHADLSEVVEQQRDVQRPRIFYRRETEPQSFIIAMPTQPLQK